MKLKVLSPMGKVKARAEAFARVKCGLSKKDDFIYFDCCVNAFLAGYKSAIRETKRMEENK